VRCTPYDLPLFLNGTQAGATYTFSPAERALHGRHLSVGTWSYRNAADGDGDGTEWNVLPIA
jgi:hypothetical protein